MEKNIVADTKLGKVRGYRTRGVLKFKGIPYAAPPIGDLRFSPPAPRQPWNGVLDATEYGPIAPQPPSVLLAMFGGKAKQSEEGCLTVNVWRPDTDQNDLPVMVWVHGGGFVTGSGADLDGARLVLRGNVVVVSVNYRLGIFGFFYIPGVTANVGLLDQIAALKWVKENIKEFGGDPKNVTIFGESAGSASVCTLMAMPAAKGLFHRVIAQSGACHPMFYSKTRRKEASDRAMSNLNIEEGDIEALRKVSVEELIKADPTIKGIQGGSFATDAPTLGPVVDGSTLPEHPLKAFDKGYAKDIELLIGTNQDEVKLWGALNPNTPKVDESKMLKRTTNLMKALGQDENKAKQMINAYQQARKGKEPTEPQDIVDAYLTDFAFRIPSIRLAEAQHIHQPNTYMYLFTWKLKMPGGVAGAVHALELAFVFGLLGEKAIGIFPSKSEETEMISNNMMDSWTSFA
ncbi:MAG: carboxylesterase/lipase family protein, partial [Candidatus Hodarchaeota archaeon]